MTLASISSRELIARARNANFIVFAVNGMSIASWLSRLPDVKTHMQLSTSTLSFLLLSIACGSLIGLPTAGPIAEKLGTKSTVRLGGLVSMIGLLIAGISVQFDFGFAFAAAGLFIFGLSVGVWDVAQNLEGTIIEQKLERAIMPWFHAAFSGGTVLGALIGALATQIQLAIGVHISVIAVLSVVLLAWSTASYLADEPAAAHEVQKADKQLPAWFEPRTLLIGLMVFAAAFAEGTANDWMALAFVEGHGTTKATGVLGLAVFLTFMTAGRLFGTKALDRYGRVPVLRALGCALVVFGGTVGAYIGAAIWGLGASLGFPVGMSAASDDPKRAAARLSVVATLGYVAFLAGPPIIGFLGDGVGVLRALLAVGVVGALAFLAVPAAKPIQA
jgi:fucose permease